MNNRSENKICQSCQNEFTIEPEDFQFYEKMDVPAPTFCFQCRLQRKAAYRNDLILYHDVCGLCNKKILSMYNPELRATVYCSDCWWSDEWNSLHFESEYDFDKPFFEQIREHFLKVPRPATDNKASTNCQYCQATTNSSNCYLLFGGYESENCMYGSHLLHAKSTIDCTRMNKADLCYQSQQCTNGYKLLFSRYSFDCLESAFLYDCRGCSNCVGCIGLRNKHYYILNQAYSKEEYQEKLKELDFGSYQNILKFKQEFQNLYDRTPKPYAFITNSVNSTGNMLHNCKSCKNCYFIQDGAEDCKHSYFCGFGLKESYDIYGGGIMSELTYECSGMLNSQNIKFSERIFDSMNVTYSSRVYNCKNIFGCSGVQNKKFCILNKQYSEDEYNDLHQKIRHHMNEIPYIDTKGREYRYGEYFPIETSMFQYSDSTASEHFQLTQEEISAQGYIIYKEKERDYTTTMSPDELPDHIDEVSDSIAQEVIQCTHGGVKCMQAYKITQEELNLYRQIGVPLPRMCFTCRHYERTKEELPVQLWKQSCSCNGTQDTSARYNNTTEHVHKDKPCSETFMTPYNPTNDEIVYCKDCYEHEIL